MIKFSALSVVPKNYETCLDGLFRRYSHGTKPEEWQTAKPYESIPGPKPTPLLGNYWKMLVASIGTMDFLTINKTLRLKYGDICVVRNLTSVPDMVYIYDPNNIEKFIRNEGKWPERYGILSENQYRNVVRKDVFGDQKGLISARGEMWQDIRSKVNPIFMQPRAAKLYINSIDEVASDFTAKMKYFASTNEYGEMPDNFLNELNKWSFESIGVIALDRRLGCVDRIPNPQAEKMVKYMCEIFKLMALIDFTPIGQYLIRFNMAPWKKFVKYQDYFTDMTLKYLDEAEEKMKSSDIYQEKSESEKSVFEKLLKIDKKLAMIITLDMLGAGIDTTAKTTASTLYFIAKHQSIQDKLRQELLEVMPTPDTALTAEKLNKLVYLKAIFKEVGRMVPVAAAHTRITTKDLVLCGYQIPTGTAIIAPTLFLSVEDENYKRPKEFIPERWLKTTSGDLSPANVNQFITLPFGFGPRACIGQRFAKLNMEILVARIVRNFKLSWPHREMTFGQDLLYGIKDPLKIHIEAIN